MLRGFKTKLPFIRSMFLVFAAALQFAVTSTARAGGQRETHPLDLALESIALQRTDLSVRSDLSPNPFALGGFSRWMENPLTAPKEGQATARALFRHAENPLLWILELAKMGDLRDVNPFPIMPCSVRGVVGPPVIQEALSVLLDAVCTANARLSEIRKSVDQDRQKLIEKHLYPRVLRGDPEVGETSAAKELRDAIDAAAGIERGPILGAGLTIMKALGEVKALLTETTDWREGVRTISFATDLGMVKIGGPGDDLHEEPAVVLIDVGGNDLYRGRIASGKEGQCSVVVDLEGDDVYLGGDFTQACGMWGIGVLLDLGGNDLYRAGICSQGAGIFGMGLLIDEEGEDTYLGAKFVQAASAWGWGGLIDLAGEDTYHCEDSGQAYAETLGISSLCDLKGNDKYSSGAKTPDPREPDMNQSLSQGFAFGMRNVAAGGFALLADASGNDFYQCQYFGQGASYWMGVGILYDETGKDTYVARRYAQGAGIHFSFGALLDAEGDDHFFSWGVSQGCGHDYGIGLLINAGGCDTYTSHWLSSGASEANGIGILIDHMGDDGYDNSSGLGIGRLTEIRRAGGVGLFVDTQGKDRYSKNGSNDSIWTSNRWGVGMDGAYGETDSPEMLCPGMPPPTNETAEKVRDRERKRLSMMLSASEEMPYPVMIETKLSVASHWGFEKEIPREAKEQLLNLPPEHSVPAMVELLSTPDVMSHFVMEKFFSAHPFYASSELTKRTNDPDPICRARALHYLGKIEDSEFVEMAMNALGDPSWRVKAMAIRIIGDLLDSRRIQSLLEIRRACTEALAANDPDPFMELNREDEKRLVLLRVLSRLLPSGYQQLGRYSEPSSVREAQKDFADLVFDHVVQILAVVEKWIEDIRRSDGIAIPLMGFLADSDPAVRQASAYSLGQIYHLPAIGPLLELLKDPDRWVRDAAVLSLALYKDETVRRLEPTVKGESRSFRILAIDLLSRIGNEKARVLLGTFVSDPDPHVRRAAKNALSRLGVPVSSGSESSGR